MTDLWSVKVLYTGQVGLPGTNSILSSTGDTDVDDLRTALIAFYNDWMDNVVSPVVCTIPSTGDKIDSSTGQVSGVWSSGSDEVINAAGSGNPVPFSNQVLVQLQTDLIVNGRKLHGRIFLPGAIATNDDGGKVNATMAAAIAASAVENLVGTICVYSSTHKTFATVTGAKVWEQWAVLRSRRP